MSKKSLNPTAATLGEKRQVRGPLSPTAPEVTLYTSIADGKFGKTDNLPPRPRPASILVTDIVDLASSLNHSDLILVGDAGPRQAVTDACWKARKLPADDRTITVAGSAALIEASLDEAFRIIAECPEHTELPFPISEWRTSRPKGSHTLTLIRD